MNARIQAAADEATAFSLDLPPDFDVMAACQDALIASRRGDGWSAAKQRGFLVALAGGDSVERACRSVGMSHQSAYAFRQSAAGSAFAIGWHAAQLLQRQRLADTLMARAIDGQVETVSDEAGRVSERRRIDNRLGLALLARLDRLAEADRSGEEQAARLVARDWERWLDLVGTDAGPARAGLFLAARAETAADEASAAAALQPLVALARADLHARTGVTDAGEIDTADLDPAQRGRWSAEQWARAEAAGLLHLAAPPPPEPEPAPCEEPAAAVAADPASGPQLPQHSLLDGKVWYDLNDGWQTSFPPPPDFEGDEGGDLGEEDYWRTLSDEEEELVEALLAASRADAVTAGHIARDAWCAAVAEQTAAFRSASEAVRDAGDGGRDRRAWPLAG